MIAFEKSVGAVVFRRRENKIEYLLLQYLPGHWGFPRGHQEKGESDEETLRREIGEETGINDLKMIAGFVAVNRYFYRANGGEKEDREKRGRAVNIWKKVIFHLAETRAEEVKISSEHTDYKWLGFDAALERVTYKNAKNVLKKADEFLKN